MHAITTVARQLDLGEADLELYGRYKSKLSPEALARVAGREEGKLIVVTAMTPTPPGEGKTTVAIGLAMALSRLKRRACLCIRQPSLGPLFGMKGGATGGGRATVEPAQEINLHFTGDLHAVTAAQNLLAALVDNHFYHGNALSLEPDTTSARRCMDICDRSLRRLERVSPSAAARAGNPQSAGRGEVSFELTAACEMMATMTLARDFADLKERLGRIIVGLDQGGAPITAADLNATGALAAVLRDAWRPNLVQTCEGTPALVHLGPFGNIGAGTNSLIATSLSRRLAEYTVTEAGFATDLGLEKFCDLICRAGQFTPDAAVLVATVRALKYHGGVPAERVAERDGAALEAGFANLAQHIDNVRTFGLPCVVALNRFPDDDPEEVQAVARLCEESGVPCALTNVYTHGGEGGQALAEAVQEAACQANRFRFLYETEWPLDRKLSTIASTLYGAERVTLLPEAREKAERLARLGLDRLPLCMAKTHLSLSDNAALRGRPRGFTVTIRDLRVMAGAGYIVCYSGAILTMPGLPRTPAAERIAVTDDGRILGLA
jgi:formate--tetrahydrofolate ligase